MSGFSKHWLALREAADRHARDPDLLRAMADHFRECKHIQVTEIGCGTGAGMRALAPLLPPHQSWCMVDRDPALLAAISAPPVGSLPAAPDLTWHAHVADLQQDIEQVIALPADLVVMSALLDLMPKSWPPRLADALAAVRRPVYAALSYDGRTICTPSDPFDGAILAAFNAHQRMDKGRGEELGPDAASTFSQSLVARNFTVRQATADWHIGPDQRELQHALLEGWRNAVSELGTLDPAHIAGWHHRRHAAVAAGSLNILVGHTDLWAYPR